MVQNLANGQNITLLVFERYVPRGFITALVKYLVKCLMIENGVISIWTKNSHKKDKSKNGQRTERKYDESPSPMKKNKKNIQTYKITNSKKKVIQYNISLFLIIIHINDPKTVPRGWSVHQELTLKKKKFESL